MATRLTRTRWLPVVSGAVAAVLAFAALPMPALANDELSPGTVKFLAHFLTGGRPAVRYGYSCSSDTSR